MTGLTIIELKEQLLRLCDYRGFFIDTKLVFHFSECGELPKMK